MTKVEAFRLVDSTAKPFAEICEVDTTLTITIFGL